MKKTIYSLGVIAAAAISLVSCQKEISAPDENPVAKGTPFEIIATSADTKTVNNGLETEWAGNESINLFYAAAGSSEYNNGGEFKTTESGVSVKFNGTIDATKLGDSNDWYAFYPYTSQITSPANVSSGWVAVGGRTDASQQQKGPDSKEHLAGTNLPMYAIANGVEKGTTPELAFNHLASVIKVHVTNSTSESVAVSSVSFTAPEDIVGTYYIDFSTATPKYAASNVKYVSSTANLKVTDAEITAGASADFYLAIKPFTAKSGDKLSLAVNGQTKEITLPKDFTFTAGHIKPLNFNYDIVAVKETWTLIGGNVNNMVDGEYVILAKKGTDLVYLPNTAISKNPKQESQTIFDGTTVSYSLSDVNSLMRWSFTKNDDGTWTIASASGNYLSGSTQNTGIAIGTTKGKWTITTHTSNASTLCLKNDNNRFLGTYQKGDDWRNYNSATADNYGSNGLGSQIYLYYCGEIKTTPSIVCSDVTGLSAREGIYNLTYTITNPIEGTALEVSCDGTVVTKATASEGSISYSVAANSTTAAREGNITLTYGDVTKVVTVSQNAPVFKVSRTEFELAATAGAKATITLTSDFNWLAEVSDANLISVSPDVCDYDKDGYTDGKTTVTITAKADNATDSTIDLGTVTFTNEITAEELVVAVKQKGNTVL